MIDIEALDREARGLSPIIPEISIIPQSPLLDRYESLLEHLQQESDNLLGVSTYQPSVQETIDVEYTDEEIESEQDELEEDGIESEDDENEEDEEDENDLEHITSFIELHTKILYTQYPYFKSIVDSVFSDWAFIKHNDELCLTIRLAEVTLKNTQNGSHTIKDLFVIVPIVRNQFRDHMYGGRGDVTLSEAKVKYRHSHLSPTTNCDYISSFCLGSGAIKEYFVRFNLNPTEDNLLNIIYNIKIYVAWESLEGRPHICFSKIGKQEVSKDITVSYYEEEMLKKYLQSEYIIPLTIRNTGNQMKIDIDKNILEKQLVDFALSKVFKDIATSKYYTEETLSQKEYVSSNLLLVYKGVKIYTKFTRNEKITIQDKVYYAHPYVTEQFYQKLFRGINHYYFKKEAGLINPNTNTVNIGESIKQNKTPRY